VGSDGEWAETAHSSVFVLAGVVVAGILLVSSSWNTRPVSGSPGAGVVVALTVAALLGYAA
jgi:hypothetical protein